MLIEARNKTGLSQRTLAQRLGQYATYVSKYEMGERRLDFVEMIAILHALEIEPAQFTRKFVKGLLQDKPRRSSRMLLK